MNFRNAVFCRLRTSFRANSSVSGFDGTRKTTDEEVREKTVQNRQRNQMLELRGKSTKDVRIQSYWVTISVY